MKLKVVQTRMAILAAILALAGLQVMAQPPGTLVDSVDLPEPGFGVSVAADCEGNIYYTLNGDTNFYVMDKDGVLLDTLSIVDAASGVLRT